MRAAAVCSTLALLAASAGCGDEEPPPAPAPTYEDVDVVLTRSCTFSNACHGGTGSGKANLNFMTAADKTTVLNGIAACQYDLMPRVDPGDPENSWLMVKIDGTYDEMGDITFTPEAGWAPPPSSECEGFGTLMPQSLSMPTALPMDEVEMIREWIRIGAPGPT